MSETVGFSFPLAVDPTTGKFCTTKTLSEDIKESISILIRTSPKERVIEEEYGCGIYPYLFQEINTDMLSRLEQEIYNSILRWEVRAENVTVEINKDISQPEKLVIDIFYSVAETGESSKVNLSLSLMEGVIGNGK